MGELIMKLKDINDELGEVCPSGKTDSFDKAMELCSAMEHLDLAKHHLCIAINKLIIFQCFEPKQESDTE